MAFKHSWFSLKVGTSRFGATKIPPSRPLPESLRDPGLAQKRLKKPEKPPSGPLPEPLRYPGLARNVFSLVFLSDPGYFPVKKLRSWSPPIYPYNLTGIVPTPSLSQTNDATSCLQLTDVVPTPSISQRTTIDSRITPLESPLFKAPPLANTLNKPSYLAAARRPASEPVIIN